MSTTQPYGWSRASHRAAPGALPSGPAWPRPRRSTYLTGADLQERTKSTPHESRGWNSWQLGKGAPSYVSHDRWAASAAQHGEMENTKWGVTRDRDSPPTPARGLSPRPAPSPALLWAQHGQPQKNNHYNIYLQEIGWEGRLPGLLMTPTSQSYPFLICTWLSSCFKLITHCKTLCSIR